jgi:hypothetical protein
MTVEVLRSPQQQPSSPACDDCCVGGSHVIGILHSLPAWTGIDAASTTLDPGFRRDDGGSFTIATTITVITCM